MSQDAGAPPATTKGRFASPLHDARTATVLGVALGITFTICFVTGVLSHLVQDPPGWFLWPSRPAGLYRITQGLHVITGIATIPLLIAKLWVVYPHLFTWPPVTSVGHAVERLALLPLVGGSLLLLLTGLGNINIWRPWEFNFRTGHYAAAWIVIGALIIHVAAKWATIRRPPPDPPPPGDPPPSGDSATEGALDRRSFLTTAFATSGLLAVLTVGQTVEPLRRLALLSPRRPDIGPQGFPVNRTARAVDLTDVDTTTYRLIVDGPGVSQPLSLTYQELEARPQHEATLPIVCVEGWSTTQRWQGVRVRDLLDAAGAAPDAEATVIALHESRRQRTSPLNRWHARDPDTLLALRVNDEVLAPDHGFPVRLIGPNRPGVDQTKWVSRIEVHP